MWATLKTNDLAAFAPASFNLRVCKGLQLKQTRLQRAGANKLLTSFHDSLAMESAIEKGKFNLPIRIPRRVAGFENLDVRRFNLRERA